MDSRRRCVRGHITRVPAKTPREIATRILREWAQGKRPAEALLGEGLPGLSAADRGLCQELVLGVIRRQATLDWLIERKTDGRRQQELVRILLRLGVYQIFFLDRIPSHAAVNETVNLARAADLAAQSGFINAVLRNCLREEDDWRAKLDELRQTQPAIGHSHPHWLVQRWADRWADYDKLLAWNNLPAPVYARRNTLRATTEELEAQWQAEGVTATPAPQSWLGDGLMWRLETNGSPASLPSFAEGKFYVQDPSTLAAVQELDPRTGENILDLCAAPGGKTTAIAQRMQDEGNLLATDIDDARLKRLRENLDRLGITCVQPKPLHGIDLKRAGPFDRILVDAPCTNTGVMRRRVEVRWRLRAEDIPAMARSQADLLSRAAARLKPGGVLVYSTCSLETEENEAVVEAFLKQRKDFTQETARTLTPMADEVDGAFVARLRRA